MTGIAPAHTASIEGRLEQMRATHRYGAVLGAIFVSFFLAALLPDSPWATSLIVFVLSGTLLIAIWTAGWAVTERTASFGLATAGSAAAVINLFWQSEALTATLGVVTGLLTIAIAVVIAAGAVRQGEVNLRSVAGAISVYVLLGMLFMFLYGLVAAVDTTPFFAQGIDGTRSLRLYFSFVTLATLGYGDYTPAGDLGHMLAVLEALIGQLYLVTVVAVVVTRVRPAQRTLAHRKASENDGPRA